MDSLSFLDRSTKSKVLPVYALHGDEDFLKRLVLVSLRELVLGADGDEFGFSTYPGEKADFAAVRDELETLPFLGPRRLVVIENADPFVTRYRALLEKYVAEPSANGVLALDVKTWVASTRLAKALDGNATIVCKAPAAYKVPEWCARWAQTKYGKELNAAAARLLVDLAGTEMGVLDQELAKLATFVGTAKRIDAKDVDQLVGSNREENTFKIFDALAADRKEEALGILDRLFDQGEDAIRMLGAFSHQLRRMAQASRLAQNGSTLPAALESVGVPPFARASCEQHLRRLGRRRADRLYDWLLETDLGLKGGSELPPRTLLERLVVRLAG